MLAGGKEYVGCAKGITAAERCDPLIVFGGERFRSRTAQDSATRFFDAFEKCIVKNAARERERLKRQRGSDEVVAGREAKFVDDSGAEIQRVDASLTEIIDGLGAEELAANLVMWAGFLFDEHDVASGGGKAKGDHGARGTTADDEMIDTAKRDANGVLLRLTQRRAGKSGWMETSSGLRHAAAHIRRQSSGMKERAIDTGPSC